MNQNISISGGFWTGSSALIDLLKEHKSCESLPFEFALFSHGQLLDNIIRLNNADNKPSEEESKKALEEDLWRMENFNKNELSIIKPGFRYLFSKMGLYPKNIFVRKAGVSDLLGDDYKTTCLNTIQYLRESMQNKNHINIDRVRASIEAILEEAQKAYNKNKNFEALIFDQMIAPSSADSSNRILPDHKIIAVDRDWRDQYVEIRNEVPRMAKVKKTLGVNVLGLEVKDEYASPAYFIKKIREKIELDKQSHTDQKLENILWISFEELVNDTQNTARKVFDFLDLDIGLWDSKTVFFPEKSKQNIGIWKSSKYVREVEELSNHIV